MLPKPPPFPLPKPSPQKGTPSNSDLPKPGLSKPDKSKVSKPTIPVFRPPTLNLQPKYSRPPKAQAINPVPRSGANINRLTPKPFLPPPPQEEARHILDAQGEEYITEIRYPERWQTLYEEKQNFYIAKLSPLCTIPKETLRWCRSAADERAAQEGMRFHEATGQDVVDWIEDHCILYEGSKANTPLLCDDWQFEFYMQMFGWLRNSEEIGRWVRRYRKAGVWIAKKNAKSPTLAATALYMLIGDGEPGQKCYAVARDGKQAMIAFTHAMEMVKASPLLQAECKINHSFGIIRHLPSKSEYKIVHMENYRSTEGYNGSIFIDETHVVQQQHVDPLKRAGISRDEPIHLEMSTSGNNVDEYGYSQYQYGKKLTMMESDSDYNPEFLFMDFSIDQNVTLSDLRDESFVLRHAPLCNPALGRILRMEEFIGDYRASLRSDTELRNFAMYRLNLWLKGTSSWIELSDWKACATSPISTFLEETTQGSIKQYRLEDLVDYPCVAGIDLSRTRDMTALSLIFAVPDEELGVRPYTWTWHWLPRFRAIAYQGYVDLYKDEFEPWIEFIPGKTIDYDKLAMKIEWIRTNFDLRSLGYDAWKASDLIRTLITDYGWSDENLIKVPQNMKFLSPITQEFERWVIRHEVHHPNNHLLTWQFGHVELDVDRIGNYKPIKPDPDSYKKIDGIMSLLIAGATLVSDESIWCPKQSILMYDREYLDAEARKENAF